MLAKHLDCNFAESLATQRHAQFIERRLSSDPKHFSHRAQQPLISHDLLRGAIGKITQTLGLLAITLKPHRQPPVLGVEFDSQRRAQFGHTTIMSMTSDVLGSMTEVLSLLPRVRQLVRNRQARLTDSRDDRFSIRGDPEHACALATVRLSRLIESCEVEEFHDLVELR
jgi:hypothetical protein